MLFYSVVFGFLHEKLEQWLMRHGKMISHQLAKVLVAMKIRLTENVGRPQHEASKDFAFHANISYSFNLMLRFDNQVRDAKNKFETGQIIMDNHNKEVLIESN